MYMIENLVHLFMRTIILVDMDAYFASIEQKSNPNLRGKPIGVVGSAERTVITTASYEARAVGVRTGMNKYEAKKICPDLVFVTGNNRKYTYTCAVLSELYGKYTPEVEVYSVDEAFLDITDTGHLFGGPLDIAVELKREIKKRFGINATVGIGYNKLIAKLATDISKPDGLRRITMDDVSEVLEDLPTDELWGIGRNLAKRLEQIGIKSCGDLGRASVTMLRSRFGIIGERLKAMGLGLDSTPVCTETEDAKSIGHSMTLPRDIISMEDIEAYIIRLSEMTGRRARRHELLGSVITVTVRYKSFETFSKRRKIRVFTNDTHMIYNISMEIIKSIRLKEAVRLLGVSISNLRASGGQPSLLQEYRKRNRLLETMDSVNNRYGENTLTWALARKTLPGPPGVISPAWRPSGVHRTEV